MISSRILGRHEETAEAAKKQAIGKIVTWDVNAGMVLTRSQFTEKALNAGLPPQSIPKPLRDRNRFSRTLKTLREQDFKTMEHEGVFHRVIEDDDRSVWIWTTHEVDPRDETVIFAVERKFTYDKNTRLVTANDPDGLVGLKTTLQVLYQDPHADPVVLTYVESEVDRGDARVQETQRRVTELMADFADLMLPRDIRAYLVRVATKFARGVPMRRNGGVYIIPRPHFEMVNALKCFVKEQLGHDCEWNSASLFDNRDVGDDDDVHTMLTSFRTAFFSRIGDIERQLETMKTKNSRDNTFDSLVTELGTIAEQADVFRRLLGFEVRDYQQEIERVDDVISTSRKEMSRKRSKEVGQS